MNFNHLYNDCLHNISLTNDINNKTILNICYTIYKKYKKQIKFDIILKILKYNNNFNIKLIRDCEKLFSPIIVPLEYTDIDIQFNILLNLPQPEQRTKEWFEYRYNRITASDTASAIDQNPYEVVEEFILKKSDPSYKFLDNKNVYHGKKYEPIATSIYEYIYNNKVQEFGALPSNKYKLLGASPDGICSKQSLDYQFSPLIGRMLEIKCVVSRQIYTSGEIIGHICPYYYYCQIQQQLECCELDKCDFWQCKLVEYKNREDYLGDLCTNTIHTIGTNSEQIEIDNRLKKGIILKFLPKEWIPEFDKDSIEWKSKFIYPSNILLNEEEYDFWVSQELTNWMINYPHIAKTHYFETIIYWKLELSHNVTIERDSTFINNILPILTNTWERVEYYRNNIHKLSELKEIIKKRKKYSKINTLFTINIDLIKNNILFLDSNNNDCIDNENNFID